MNETFFLPGCDSLQVFMLLSLCVFLAGLICHRRSHNTSGDGGELPGKLQTYARLHHSKLKPRRLFGFYVS